VPSPPKVYDNGVAEGWQSGIVTLPSTCVAGGDPKWPMTAYECSVCLKSSDSAGCLKCSKDLFKDACGYSRATYLKQTKADAIANMYKNSCLPCTCYPIVASRNRCFEVVKSIGIYTAKDYSMVDTILTAAAQLCDARRPALKAGTVATEGR